MIPLETKKINFWIKQGYFHLSYGEVSLTRSKSGNDKIMDFCDSLLGAIHDECIPRLLQGETCKIDLLDDPHTLIFVPKGDMVTVVFETEVAEWFEPRNEFTAPLEEWFRTVQQATLDLIQEMQDFPGEYYRLIPVSSLIEKYHATEKMLQNAGYQSNVCPKK